ncbi:MAG: ComF family protein [Methylobacteriaceae bacterium]|nr:ComF family protein [Methylobacteriaceae bacterium]
MASARAIVRRCVRVALDVVYPPTCLACSAPTAAVGTLCSICWRKVRFIERPYCERLGIPFAQDGGPELLSPEAVVNPPVFHRARAVAVFDDGPVRELVHRLKYGDRLELARPMGRWMARAGADLLKDADVLVPVPLHRLRLWSRRFNQAGALAHSISKASHVPVESFALHRIKATPPQVRLTRTQRAENVQGAFRVPDEMRPRVHDRRIVLVDDVLTSGATLNAAARALSRAGARSIDVLVFARVVAGQGLPI